jgi:endonuclease YncB( thermonuclease family)
MRSAAAIFLCLLGISPALGSEVKAVPDIVDADTIWAGTTKVRLSGIDAPETDQICLDAAGKTWDCGIEARNKLRAHAGTQAWTCELKGLDLYKRALGDCKVAGEDVSRWLVRNGWALAFRKYSTVYVADEEYAQQRKLGLWSGAFIAPWDWRHRNPDTVILGSSSVPVDAQRSLLPVVAQPPSPDCAIKGNLKAANQCIYHVPGGKFYNRLSMDRVSERRWFCSATEAEAAGCRKSKL